MTMMDKQCITALHGCHYQSRTERENDMSRLIDADLLMRKCEKWLKPKAPDEDEMVSLTDIAVSMLMEIEEQPTAFDVEKVVEQLQGISDEAQDEISVCEREACQYYYGFSDGVDKAIEIVKRGGRDEE